MAHLRIREIMDELNHLGGMTGAHHALITELVAVCLSSAGPKPHETFHPFHETSTERVRAFRERKKASKVKQNETVSETESAVDSNLISNKKTDSTAPSKRGNVSRGTRLPDDWQPSESLWAWGKEKLPEADLRFETAAFKDYWAAQPGSRGIKLDWDKTWKNWIREAVRRRVRFKPNDKVVPFVSSGPKRTWSEIKAERANLEGK